MKFELVGCDYNTHSYHPEANITQAHLIKSFNMAFAFNIQVIHRPTVYDYMVCSNFAEKRLVTVSITPSSNDEHFQKPDVMLPPLEAVKDLFPDEILMIKEDMSELSVIEFESDDYCSEGDIDSDSYDDCGSERDPCSDDLYIDESWSEWALMF